jgi:hypothetical protein
MTSRNTPLLFTVAILVGVVLIVRQTQRPDAAPAPASRDVAPRSDTTRSSAADSGSISPVDPAPMGMGANAELPRADFMYLFDVSASTHFGGPRDPFLLSTAMLVPAVNALRDVGVLLPQRHRVGTIGAASLMQLSLCDIRAEAPMVFRTSDTTQVTKRVRACEARLRAMPAEQATDIRGALHYASLTLRGDRPEVRGIVLVSDLVEFVPAGQVSAEPNLQGLCVAVYSVMTPAGAARPDSLQLLEEEWKERLSSWGARRVRVQSALGFDGADLAAFFHECRTQ